MPIIPIFYFVQETKYYPEEGLFQFKDVYPLLQWKIFMSNHNEIEVIQRLIQ
jgi:hypothetical protein